MAHPFDAWIGENFDPLRENPFERFEIQRRGEAGRLSRLVENRSEGPEFEQWDAQRGCSRPRPPSIYFPFESFREFSARQRPRAREPGFDPRTETWPFLPRFLGVTVDNPYARGEESGGNTLLQATISHNGISERCVWKSV